MYLRNCFFHSSHIFKDLVRLSSTNSHLFDFEIPPKFSIESQQKILKTLNESDVETLSRLNMSKAKIKSLDAHKRKNGPFRSLSDILEVDGLSVKLLEKLCEQIIADIPLNDTEKKKTNTSSVKKLNKFLAPPLPNDLTVTSAVGIHLAPMGISWSKLTLKENLISVWGFEDFVSLPKKMLPTDTFNLAIKILKQIPIGDIYIFEGASSMGLQGQKQAQISPYTQQFELTSMLLALINSSALHNPEFNKSNEFDVKNKVYFLRSKLSARLFNTLVGNECVSSNTIISQFLDNESSQFTLPCTRIVVEPKLKNDYCTQVAAHKELLGQSLMLTVAFTDLCWRKNTISLAAVAPRRR